MRLAYTYALLERPAVIVPTALLLLAAAGGMMWTNVTAHRPVAAAPAPLAVSANITGLVAGADIARGQVLTARDFLPRSMAPAHLPAGLLRQATDVQGHMALADIKAGTPLLAHDLSPAVVQGLAGRVPDGLRAHALAVTEAEIAGGFLQAGDHVDLYATLPGALFPDRGTHGDQSRSTLLMPSVAVLAVGAKLDNDGVLNTAVRTVTLALDANVLAKVALAARLGTITLAIRNPSDDAALPPAEASIDMLLNKPVHAPVVRHVAPGIPVLMGTQRTTLAIP